MFHAAGGADGLSGAPIERDACSFIDDVREKRKGVGLFLKNSNAFSYLKHNFQAFDGSTR